jgi:hypothetical protein
MQMQTLTANAAKMKPIQVGPFMTPGSSKASPDQIFQAITALKAQIVKKDYTPVNDALIATILLSKRPAQQFRPQNPYTMIPIINVMRANYLAWQKKQQAPAPQQPAPTNTAVNMTSKPFPVNAANLRPAPFVPNQNKPTGIQVTESAPNQPQAEPTAPTKTLPIIVASSLQWAQTKANQPMTAVGAFVFPQYFLNGTDSYIFQEPFLVNMLQQTISELKAGKLTGNVHWDALETMIPIIVFSIGKFPTSLAPNVAIPQLIQMAMELGQRYTSAKQTAPTNTAVNMPPNNNELNSNIPAYMNTNASANAPVNIPVNYPQNNVNANMVNANVPVNVPNANVNYPQNNVNLPNANVEPSLVNQATEFVSSPTGMAATAIAVGLGWYLITQRK